VHNTLYLNIKQKKKKKSYNSNDANEKKRYGSLESIKYVIHFLIMHMKNSTTTHQTLSNTPISSITNYSISRIRQTEVFEDYSQVRVYCMQGFFLSKLKSNSRLSLLLLSWHSFFLS
jgi:hypothetical protein